MYVCTSVRGIRRGRQQDSLEMSNASTFLFWSALHNVALPHPSQQFCVHTHRKEQWSHSPGEETQRRDYWWSSTLPSAKDRTKFKLQTPSIMMMMMIMLGMSQGSNPAPQHVTTLASTAHSDPHRPKWFLTTNPARSLKWEHTTSGRFSKDDQVQASHSSDGEVKIQREERIYLKLHTKS